MVRRCRYCFCCASLRFQVLVVRLQLIDCAAGFRGASPTFTMTFVGTSVLASAAVSAGKGVFVMACRIDGARCRLLRVHALVVPRAVFGITITFSLALRPDSGTGVGSVPRGMDPPTEVRCIWVSRCEVLAYLCVCLFRTVSGSRVSCFGQLDAWLLVAWVVCVLTCNRCRPRYHLLRQPEP